MSGATQKVAILAPRSAVAQSLAAFLHAQQIPLAYLGRALPEDEAIASDWSVACDLTDFHAVSDGLEAAREGLGGLTGIVNCAGSILLRPAHLTSQSAYEETIAANLTTAFATVRAAKSVFKREGGSVVLISSAAAQLGMGNHEAIATAKAGVEGLARSAAATYAGSGIRFNVVSPGLVESPLSEELTQRESSRTLSESLHPLGRLGTAEDVSRAIAWFIDPAQSWVTGQVLGVDGGLGRVQPRPRVTAGGA
jgi:NAD(P)-dependent dehydrogenase (short-subunit alcohol dehydrogenase family)